MSDTCTDQVRFSLTLATDVARLVMRQFLAFDIVRYESDTRSDILSSVDVCNYVLLFLCVLYIFTCNYVDLFDL